MTKTDVRNLSLCTLALGLAMSLNPGATMAASHCSKLTEEQCSQAEACRWVPAVPGAMNKSPRRAHCRLDVRAAGELARRVQEERKGKSQ